MNHRPSTLTTLLLTRLGLSPNSTARASKSRARHLLAPLAIAAMLLGLAGNANAQALSFGAEPSIDDQVYTVGQAVNVTLPAATGGVAPLTYSLTRTNGNAIPPPRGVIISPTNRTLRGTPEQVAEAVSYRWTVTDSASPVVMQHIPFTITVNAAPVENIAPAFVAGASIGAETYYQDTDITPLTLPRATGGEGAITYALTPAIPGMFFDTVTRVLSGAPTTEAVATTYTYTAGDTDGSAPGTDEASLTISITVLANTIPAFSVPRASYTFTVGTVVNQTLPVATGGDGTLVYTLSRVAFLPAGLTFNAAATPPTITGTPTTAASRVTYRYNVDDSDANEATGDGSSLSIRITIRGAAATGITMTIRDLDGDPLTSLNEGDDPTTFRLYFDTVPALSGFTADQDVAITVSTPVAGQVGYTAAGIADFIDRDVASTESRQLQLTVTDDDVATADGVVTYTATVSPSGFTATAMITLVDNEISIVTTPAAVTLATGATADYTVQLDQEPPGSVTVSVASVADAIATVSRSTRTFTAANWNVPASVTVTGMRGGSTTISHSATAAGGFGYPSTDVMVTVTPVSVDFAAGTLVLDQSFRVGTAVDLTLPTATGGTTYRLGSHADQSLPAGLTFDGATRVLSGTPTATQVAEPYAYVARNPDDLDDLNFDITVVPMVEDTAPVFDTVQTVNPQQYVVGTTIATLTLPTVASPGNGETTYTLTPALPDGLTFDAATRTIDGTPTTAGTETVTYTWTAADADMTTTADDEATRTFTITVNAPVPDIAPLFLSSQSVAPQQYDVGTAITPLTLPTVSALGNGDTTYTLTPALSAGLTFEPTTRVISGTPTAGMATTAYTWTAADSDDTTGPGDESTRTFTITVNPVPGTPPTPPTGQTLTLNPTEVTESATPTTIMATVTLIGGTYAIDRAFSFGSSSGTATERTDYTALENVNLTVPATMTSGTTTFAFEALVDDVVEAGGETLTIRTTLLTVAGTGGDRSIPAGSATLTINDPAPMGTAPAFADGATIAPATYTVGQMITPLTLPAVEAGTGNAPITYTLNPAVPGLTLNPTTRVLTGAPTTAAAVAGYAYTATDTDNDAISLAFRITVNAAAVAIRPVFIQVASSVFTNFDEGGTAVGGPTTFFATAGSETVALTLSGADASFFTITQAGALSFNPAPDFEMPRGMPPSTSNTNTYHVTITATASPGGLTQDQTVEVQVVDVVNEGPPADTPPAFAADAAVPARSYSRFAPIPPYTLPQATGGNGDITYTLTPAIPGLTLDADTGVLTGTPTTQAPLATYTLTAADSDMTTGTSDEATFTFEVVVHALTEATGWQLGIVPAVVVESATATELTVSASYTNNGRSADERVATFQTQGGVATAGTDYIAVPPTTITIPALETSASTTISFMATPDTETETGNESVYFVGTLRDSAGADVSVTFQRGTLFIQDPPPVPTSVTLSVNPAMVSESADATTITVTATLDGGRFAEERRVTLSADNASTATVTTDYTPAITHTITIPALATSGSVEIPFTAVMDTAVEAGGETVIIRRNLATAGGTAAVSRDITVTPVTLTINDPAADTEPTFGTTVVAEQVYAVGTVVNLTLPTVTDGNGVITYTLTPALATGLTFNAAANPPTITGTPNTQASATTYTYTATDEDDDAASLMFAISVGAAVSTTPTTQTLTISPTMVTESATATNITAMVTLTGGTYNVERLFNIRTTQSGTATAVTDYTVFSNVVLTIPANMASGSQTFPFTAIDDMTADDGETLSIDSTLLRFSGLGADTSLAVASATLTINDPVAGLTFGSATIADQTYTVGTPIPTLTLPSATGADPIFYTLNPNPNPTASGLMFQNMDGVLTLSGTPTTAGVTMYTLTAADSGSAQITLMFTVTVEAATAGTGPTFGGATVTDQAYFAATTITPVTLPEATGGDGTITYSLTPAIPGLTLNPTSRVLTGTPTTVAGATMHTYTATDTASATDTLMFSITIDAADTAPAFTAGATVSAQTYTVNTAIEPLPLPTATGGNGASTYTLTPAIPGLTLNADTGVLTGTPTTVAVATMHTYTAGDADDNRMSTDQVSLMFSITVIQAPPTAIRLSVNPAAVTESSAATTITVTATLIGGRYSTAQTITVMSANGTATSADYTTVPGTPLTILADETSGTATFMFTTVVDTIAEAGGETVLITGSAVGGIMVTPATITINDYALTVDAGADQTVASGGTITLNSVITGSDSFTAAWALSDSTAVRTALEAAGLDMTEAQAEVTRLTNALAGITTQEGTLTAPAVSLGLTDLVALAFTLTVTDTALPAGQTVAATGMDEVIITVEAASGVTAAQARDMVRNEVILPEVARSLVNSTSSSITRRVGQAVGSIPTVGSFNFAGQSMDGQHNLATALRTQGEAMNADSRDIKEMLAGSDFVLPLNATGGAGASSMAFWGSGEFRDFSGDSDDLEWDGDLTGFQLGLDARLKNNLLVGVAVSSLSTAMDYEDDRATTVDGHLGQGDYELDMTSAHPYIGWRADELDFWATVGYGTGDLEISEQGEMTRSGDVNLLTVGGGGSGMLWQDDITKMRLKGEVSQTTLEVEDGTDFAEQEVDATSIRVAVEATRSRRLAGGGIFEPSVEVAARYDGGDGETGGGAEVGGALRYRNPATGLTADGRIRALIGQGGSYEEWGISGTIRVAPGTDGQGLSFSLSPGYGNSGSGIQELWRHGLTADETTTDDYAMKLDARIGYGYGFTLNQHHGVLTPYSEMTRGTTDSYRMGLNWAAGTRFDLTLLGERRVSSTDPAEHAVLLKGEVRF